MKTTAVAAWPLVLLGLLALPAKGAIALPTAPAAVAQVPDTAFRHDIHTELSCLECHRMGSDHGALVVRDVSDCRGCHHAPERVERECGACHDPADLRNVVYPRQRALSLSVYQQPSRRVVQFDHVDHSARACAECHVAGPSFAAPDLECGSCHEEHHEPTASECMSCHVQASSDAHTLEEVHTTCSGSGCHADPPFRAPVRTRTGCLWCHQDMVDHEPGGRCVDCHFVSPSPGPSSPTRPELPDDADL